MKSRKLSIWKGNELERNYGSINRNQQTLSFYDVIMTDRGFLYTIKQAFLFNDVVICEAQKYFICTCTRHACRREKFVEWNFSLFDIKINEKARYFLQETEHMVRCYRHAFNDLSLNRTRDILEFCLMDMKSINLYMYSHIFLQEKQRQHQKLLQRFDREHIKVNILP